MVKALAALAMCLFVAGCASTSGPALRFAFDRKGQPEVFWPPAPEIPRYFYAGELVGEGNYVDDSANGRGGLRRALEWIAGIDEGAQAPVELQRPQSGVTDAQGRVYVSDASRGGVFVFDPVQGLQVWEYASGLTRFAMPVGVALSPEGRLWVADAELGFVAALDPSGKPVASIGKGILQRPTGIAYDGAARRLYVADTKAHDIKVFDPEGNVVATLGRRGEGDGEFNFPTHLAFARGELYVTDTMNSRVQVFAGGEHRRNIGARGLYLGNLVRPKGVSVDSEGNVYVIESYFDYLLVFDRQGRFLLPIGGVGRNIGQFYLPSGVWIDDRNRVFVADMFNGRVVVLQFLGGDGNAN